MKLFWKLFLSVCTCMMLAFSACGTFLIHSGFKSAREKDIQNGYNNASVVCINLVQNVKRTINLVYRDTGYEKQKNVVVRQAAQSVSVRNAGEEVQKLIAPPDARQHFFVFHIRYPDIQD